MKTILTAALALAFVLVTSARAHLVGDEAHDHATPKYDFSVRPSTAIVLRNHEDAPVLLAAANAPARIPAGLPAIAALGFLRCSLGTLLQLVVPFVARTRHSLC